MISSGAANAGDDSYDKVAGDLIKQKEAYEGTVDTTVDTTVGTVNIKSVKKRFIALNEKLDKKFKDGDYAGAAAWGQSVDWAKLNSEQQTALQDYLPVYSDYKEVCDALEAVQGVGGNKVLLEQKQAELRSAQQALADAQAITVDSNGDVQDAQNRLNQSTRNILEITTANSQTSVAWQNRLADANAALKNAQAVYDLLKEEQTSLAADINAELDLSKTNKDIQKKRKKR